MDGIQLLKRLRSEAGGAALPVILMTGPLLPQGLISAAEENMGVGPVYSKLSGLPALRKRIEDSLGGRYSPKPAAVALGLTIRGEIVLDPDTRRGWIAGRKISCLAPRSFDLLLALVRSMGPVSRSELLRKVWPDRDNPNIVDVNVFRLRGCLSSFAGIRIKRVPNGYRLDTIPTASPAEPDSLT